MELKLVVQPKRSIKRFLARFSLPGINRLKKSIRSKRSIDYFLALPDELKLQILRLALPNRQKFRRSCHCRIRESYTHDGLACYKDCWLNLVRAIPGMAGMIYEVFYGQNTMVVCNPFAMENRAFPPHSINMFVRHLHINITLTLKSLNYISRLANGDMGFPDLRSVEIDIDGRVLPYLRSSVEATETLDLTDDENEFPPAIEEMRHSLKAMAPMLFHTQKLKITYKHAWLTVTDPVLIWIRTQVCDPVEELLLQKIAIAEAQNSDAKLCRYYRSGESPESEKEYVDTWPEREAVGIPLSDRGFGRTSIKLLIK